MAIPIQVTNLKATNYVPASSRYADSTVILWSNKNIITFETYKRHSYPDNILDKFRVIPAGEEYRPDKTSNIAYGTPDFWWKIMEANNIFDVFDYKIGLAIRVPSLV